MDAPQAVGRADVCSENTRRHLRRHIHGGCHCSYPSLRPPHPSSMPPVPTPFTQAPPKTEATTTHDQCFPVAKPSLPSALSTLPSYAKEKAQPCPWALCTQAQVTNSLDPQFPPKATAWPPPRTVPRMKQNAGMEAPGKL